MSSKNDYGQVKDLLHGVITPGAGYVGYQYDGAYTSDPPPPTKPLVVQEQGGMNFLLEK